MEADMAKRRFLEIGTISEGTLRPQDLIAAFSDALHSVIDLDPAHAKLVADCGQWGDDDPSDEDDLGILSDLVDELSEALGSYCPPYTYFGTLDGDGACFGVWPSINQMEEDALFEDGLVKVNDSSEIPPDYTGTVMLVTDHGNITCAEAKDGEIVETYWSVV
jgi:hypothetical protein